MLKNNLLSLRFLWFKLKTKEFISRNAAGFLVLILFLPGVAIGDNFSILIKAMTKPFIYIASNDTAYTIKVMWWLVLNSVFIVWANAQKQAINGGAFGHYLQSIPINKTLNKRNNVLMLLLANHILWPFIFASYFFLPVSNSIDCFILILKNSLLILLLLAIQYAFVFKTKLKSLIVLIVASLILFLNLNENLQWLKFIVLLGLLIQSFNDLFKSTNNGIVKHHMAFLLAPKLMSHNLYYQMLFKSSGPSTLFRLGILSFLMIGFVLISSHLTHISNNDLIAYTIVLEALLAYYISGFFVGFDDERHSMQALLQTLPVGKIFWPIRDIFTVILLTLIIHVPLYVWITLNIYALDLIFLILYNIGLILICYPIRVYVKKSQTFFSFVVLFTITAITLFNYL